MCRRLFKKKFAELAGNFGGLQIEVLRSELKGRQGQAGERDVYSTQLAPFYDGKLRLMPIYITRLPSCLPLTVAGRWKAPCERGCGLRDLPQAAALRPARLRVALRAGLCAPLGRLDLAARASGADGRLFHRLCHYRGPQHCGLPLLCLVSACTVQADLF